MIDSTISCEELRMSEGCAFQDQLVDRKNTLCSSLWPREDNS